MKYPPSPASLLPCLATAACLLVPLKPVLAEEDPYRVETHGPRIATRIVLFFKDLAFGDNPNDRYRHLPSNQRPIMPEQHNYGARPPAPRFSLDQPPPMNGPVMPPQRQPQFIPEPRQAAPRNPVARDMPYASSDAPPAEERNTYQAGIGGQQENIPPVKIKPKAPVTQKPVVTSKPPAEQPSTSPAQEKRTIPSEAAATETQTVSNSTSATKKSWQTYNGDTGKTTPSTTQAPVETKPATTPMVTSNSSTLTGSKTTKEGRVKSPYAPFNELDVTGLPTGSLAMDPTTGKVFRVP